MKKMKSQKLNLKNATMDLKGAHCASCVYTIEHVGRKIQGIEDILVDAGKREIRVIYDGDPSSLEKITEVIQRLGYSAAVRGK
jgi:copper chaperone CopZ